MSTLTDITDSAFRRIVDANRLIRSIETHLLEDQADAITASDTEGEKVATSGTSDPTAKLAGRLAPFRRRHDAMVAAANGVHKALDHLELVCSAALADDTEHVDTEPRCPGYSLEKRTQLGGCGNVLDYYKTKFGRTPREYCSSCRKESEADKRAAAEQEGAA